MPADFTIDVTFNTSTEHLSFSGSGGSTGDVSPDIDSSSKTIDFVLVSPMGAEIIGVQIARKQEDVENAPKVLDTDGQYYTGTCFKVAPMPGSSMHTTTIRLTDVDRPNEDDSGAWFYCLGIRSDGHDYWPDPRITNIGGDGRDLPAGLYYAGEPHTKEEKP